MFVFFYFLSISNLSFLLFSHSFLPVFSPCLFSLSFFSIFSLSFLSFFSWDIKSADISQFWLRLGQRFSNWGSRPFLGSRDYFLGSPKFAKIFVLLLYLNNFKTHNYMLIFGYYSIFNQTNFAPSHFQKA